MTETEEMVPVPDDPPAGYAVSRNTDHSPWRVLQLDCTVAGLSYTSRRAAVIAAWALALEVDVNEALRLWDAWRVPRQLVWDKLFGGEETNG